MAKIDGSLLVGQERVPDDDGSAGDRDEGVADGGASQKSCSLAAIALLCLVAERRRFEIVIPVSAAIVRGTARLRTRVRLPPASIVGFKPKNNGELAIEPPVKRSQTA